MKGMNFVEIDAEKGAATIERMMDDPNYVVEQKMDGTRVLIEINPEGETFFSTRNGSPLKHTAATQHLPALLTALAPIVDFCRLSRSHVIIDGELMIGTGIYHAFDLPRWDIPDDTRENSAPLVHQPYRARRRALEGLFQPLSIDDRVQIVRSASGPEEKRALLEATRERGAEGVMIKHLAMPYESGKRVKHTVKVKHVKEADVVVIRAERGTTDAGNPSGSATFGVFNDEGHLVRLGSCSLIGKPDVKPGDVITVAYLYRQDDGGLVQPRLRTVRHDKDMTECGFDQFPRYSREVV